jgi:hypothetical protein
MHTHPGGDCGLDGAGLVAGEAHPRAVIGSHILRKHGRQGGDGGECVLCTAASHERVLSAAEEHGRSVQVLLCHGPADRHTGRDVTVRAAELVAKAPCEWPVAPMWVVSMRWYSSLVGSSFCCKHPGHAHDHRCRIALADVGAVRANHDEPMRGQVVEENLVHGRSGPRAVAPGDQRMAKPALRQVLGSEQGELRRGATVDSHARGRTDGVFDNRGERSGGRWIGRRPGPDRAVSTSRRTTCRTRQRRCSPESRFPPHPLGSR